MARTTTHPETGRTHRPGNVTAGSGVNVVLGLWLIIAPFFLATSGAAYWNDIIIGVIVAAVAATRMAGPLADNRGLSWINVAAGLWLIVAPFILAYEQQAAFWNDIIVGILIAAFALFSGTQRRTTERPVTERPTDRPE